MFLTNHLSIRGPHAPLPGVEFASEGHKIQENTLLTRITVFFKNIYNSGTTRWKKCTWLSVWDGVRSCHALSGQTAVPAPPTCLLIWKLSDPVEALYARKMDSIFGH